jgi:tRNA threonylcarbamoyl adenosine modification protein YeaZ
MSDKDLTLSIETAVQGGSISLLQGKTELDNWIGSREISKSEDVLQEIKNILKRNEIEKEELKKIVVSRGPGSHTGVRIGMAVGIGLRKALNCKLISVSPLEAMLSVCEIEQKEVEKEIITVIPIGKNQICRQNFVSQNQSIIRNEAEPLLSTIEEFINSANNSVFQLKKIIIMHRKLYSHYQSTLQKRLAENNILMDAGENIAVLNGVAGAEQDGDANFSSPVYINENFQLQTSENEYR